MFDFCGDGLIDLLQYWCGSYQQHFNRMGDSYGTYNRSRSTFYVDLDQFKLRNPNRSDPEYEVY